MIKNYWRLKTHCEDWKRWQHFPKGNSAISHSDEKHFFSRLHAACDTTFLYWEQNSFRLYLQDLFLTVRDPHRLHVRTFVLHYSMIVSLFSLSSLPFVIV